MSARPRLMLAATAAFIAAGAPAAYAAVHSRTIAVPDVRARAVEVQFMRENGARGASYVFIARNRTRERRLIRARYVSAHDHVFVVTGEAQTTRGAPAPRTDLTSRRGLALTVPPREVATFAVAFDAADTNATPEQADGRLILTSERPRRHRVVGAPLVLRLSGVRAEERDVRVSPSDVTLPLTLATPHPHFTRPLRDMLEIEARDKDAKAYVELRGPGAAALTENSKTIQTVLRRDDGKSVQVTLKVVPRGDNVAQLVLPLGDVQIDEPGRYTGTLPVGSGPRAPSVTLNVDARLWLGWAVLVVILGVFLGRMVPPFLRRERRKRRGRDAIADAIRIYGTNRRGRVDAASYDLDWLIAPGRWQVRGVFTRPQDEPTRILRELDEHSEGKELQAAVKDAKALRTRIERWAQVERAARGLLDELASHGARRGRFPADQGYPTSRSRFAVPAAYAMPWTIIAGAVAAIALATVLLDVGSIVWIATAAASALAVGVATDELLTRQRDRKPRRFSELVRADAVDVVDSLTALGSSAPVTSSAQSGEAEQAETAAGQTTGDDIDDLVEACMRAERERRAVSLAVEVWRRQDRLDGRAMDDDDTERRAADELEQIWPHTVSRSVPKPKSPETRTALEFKALNRALQRANDELKALQRKYQPFGDPSAAWRSLLDRGAAYGLWVVEAVWRSLVRLVETLVRFVFSVIVGIVRSVIGAGRGWIAVASVLSGLLTLCVPVLVYVLTLYTDTWGSPLDVLTAFAAGFGGKIALDFGSTLKMPSFGSKEPTGTGGEDGNVKKSEPSPTPDPQNGDAREQVPALNS